MAAIALSVALATKGTVREARGLTSSTKITPSLIANCTFIRPTTFSARAMATVCTFSSAMVSAESECGGRQQAESPECTPASSICSMMPATCTLCPSDNASTSTSMAPDR